jgi:hypothetical protein
MGGPVPAARRVTVRPRALELSARIGIAVSIPEAVMARESTVAWAAFPTREEAEQAIERLRSSGFSRNSVDLDRRQDGSWNVAVHTSERNLHRVEGLLHASAPMYALRERTLSAFEAMGRNPVVLAGAAVLAGVIAYSLLPRQRRLRSLRQFPSRVREAVEDLPETIRETARTVQDTIADIPGTVREAVNKGSSRETRRS